MSISKKEWDYEKRRLEEILEHIDANLQMSINALENYKNEIVSIQKELWEEVNLVPSDMDDLEGAIQAWHYQMLIDHEAHKYKSADKMKERLDRMNLSPYFGRIDFIEEKEGKAEEIYIGIFTLADRAFNNILIYDWRTPIASMFYDYEIGRAKYKCPDGEVVGALLLKRQYKITNKKIDFMFDCSIKIDDEILQEILGKSVDDKMKTIVTSIQREQNRIIRDDKHDLLIVQGAAGSGKTSIALHRIAYLLYKNRDSVNAKKYVIFSPNQIFNDYISNVLPELGEENMYQTTFIEYAQKLFDNNMYQEDMNEQMEYLLSKGSHREYKTRINSIEYKASLDFIKVLKNYVAYMEVEAMVFHDVFYQDEIVISKEDITTLLKEDYAYLPLVKRLCKIKQRLLYLLEPYKEKRMKEIQVQIYIEDKSICEEDLKALSEGIVKDEFKTIEDRIDKMTSFNLYQVYIDLFMDKKLFSQMNHGKLPKDFEEISVFTIKNLQDNTILYEDSAPLLYLKGELIGFSDISSFRHAVIDEAQDYTPLQFEVLKSIFNNCSITMLGDLNQSINTYMSINKYESAANIFNRKNTSLVKLSKTYRSTEEIRRFCRQLLDGEENIENLNRRGDIPKVIEIDNRNWCKKIIGDIKAIKERGFQSIAVICKTAEQSNSIYNNLKEHTDVKLVSKDDVKYSRGVVVIPSYLAKGLEFDAVLIYLEGEKDFCHENERKLFYTACTRALHLLHIYYYDKPSPFILEISQDCYEDVSEQIA